MATGRVRSCLCGSTSCSHGRKVSKRRPGSYAGTYQTNRETLLRIWLKDPNTACFYCKGRARTEDPWETDHIIPHAEGGSDHISNLRPAHRSCNRAAGARLAKDRRKRAADERARLRLVETARYLEEVRR